MLTWSRCWLPRPSVRGIYLSQLRCVVRSHASAQGGGRDTVSSGEPGGGVAGRRQQQRRRSEQPPPLSPQQQSPALAPQQQEQQQPRRLARGVALGAAQGSKGGAAAAPRRQQPPRMQPPPMPAPQRHQQRPQWQQPQHAHNLPALALPVVVEGPNDAKAVLRAVKAEVYVLHGAIRPNNAAKSTKMSRVLADLASLRQKRGGVVILTDSDLAGRQVRNFLEQHLPGCLHAFVPEPLATAQEATKHHEAGNVGVEHTPPGAILRALQRMRPGDAQRAAFSKGQLVELGLVAPSHDAPSAGGSAARRRLVCAYLGIGSCDGRQLLKQLNNYGFLEEDLRAAVAWAGEQLRRRPQLEQGGRAGSEGAD